MIIRIILWEILNYLKYILREFFSVPSVIIIECCDKALTISCNNSEEKLFWISQPKWGYMGFTQYGGLVVCRGLFRKVAMERKNFSAEYFEKALAKAYGCEKLSVENCEIEVVNQSGENFCSVIYRVALQFRRSPEDVLESGKYILKDLLPSVAELGTNEKQMFEEFLPEMTKILNKCSSELGERKLYAE